MAIEYGPSACDIKQGINGIDGFINHQGCLVAKQNPLRDAGLPVAVLHLVEVVEHDRFQLTNGIHNLGDTSLGLHVSG